MATRELAGPEDGVDMSHGFETGVADKDGAVSKGIIITLVFTQRQMREMLTSVHLF